MKKIGLLLMVFGGYIGQVFAQPANDKCINAITIDSLNNWCYPAGNFNNTNATVDNGGLSFSCGGGVSSKDVWFKFTAIANYVNIQVRGNDGLGNGTLTKPRAMLISSACGSASTSFVTCGADVAGTKNFVSIYSGNLIVGNTYYILVDGTGGTSGTFSLCINNYVPPATPGKDCSGAAVLCNKNAISQLSLGLGGGAITNENKNTCLAPTETASLWYKWTCKKSGTLEFDITPVNPDHDIDFAVYDMGVVGDCNTKKIIRCIGSGANGNSSSNCYGSTGLRAGEADTTEAVNCGPGSNHYGKPINMVSGRVYTLFIDNYTGSDGFTLSFGGTGTFLDPEAEIIPHDDSLCFAGNSFKFELDTNKVSAKYQWTYDWNFGSGASTASSTGRGPHTISYSTPGKKYITVKIIGPGNATCESTYLDSVVVNPQPSVTATPVTKIACRDSATGTALSVGSDGTPSYKYSWSTIPVQTTANATGLSANTYTVQLTDTLGCTANATVSLTQPEALVVTATDGLPVCAADSSFVIANADKGTDPYSFNWNGGSTDAKYIVTPNTTTTYTVTVTDSCGATVTATATVNVLSSPNASIAVTPTVAYEGDEVTFINNTTGGGIWHWDFGDGGVATDSVPKYKYPTADDYTITLIATNPSGCVDTAITKIKIKQLKVPNIFTPTGDGVNDTFVVTNRGVAEYLIEIYDRWGLKMFESTDPKKHWDGKAPSGGNAPEGTYYYIIKGKFFDNEPIDKQGWLTLMR